MWKISHEQADDDVRTTLVVFAHIVAGDPYTTCRVIEARARSRI